MRYLFAILSLSLCACSAQTRVGQAARDFTPTLGGLWTYIEDANNTPEGSWIIPFTSVASMTATNLNLNTTINAGTPVKVFVKVLDFDMGHTFTATIGGVTTASESFDDRDNNTIYWTLGKIVTLASPATTISFTFNRSAVFNARFIGFYVTTDTNEIVLRDDSALSYRYPSTAETDSVIDTTRNFIPNSSFECGLQAFWRPVTGSGYSRTNTLADMWSSATARTGTRCLAIPVPASGLGRYTLESLPIDVGSNKVATASIYYKTAAVTATANIKVRSIYPTPVGFTDVLLVGASSTATAAGWTRVSVTWTNLYYPNGQYSIMLECQGISTATTLYADDLMVEQGPTANTWAPMYDFEYDVRPSEQSQIFWSSVATNTLEFRAYNNSGSPLTKTINYMVVNRTNGISSSNTVSITAAANSAGTTNININTNEHGHFRVISWLTNQNSDTELTYILIKEPPNLTERTNSYFGAHIDHSDSALYRAQRLGIKWHRTLSTGRLRWSEIELTEGVYTYPAMNRYTNYGITILGTIGEDSPSWLTPKSLIPSKIGRYTTNLVSQYPFIKYWELWNEPEQDGSEIFGMTNYADIADRVFPLVDTWSSGSFVAAGGGVLTPTLITNQMNSMVESNRVDLFTVHEYHPNESVAPSTKTEVIDVYNRPVWNSESGIVDKGSYTGARYPFPYAGYYVFKWKSADRWYDSFFKSWQIQRNFIVAMAYGQTKMFYYDAGQRNLQVGDDQSRQFTMLDYDDSMRVKAAYLRGLWNLLDENSGRGPVSNDARMEAFAFVVGSTNIVAFRTLTNCTIALSGVSASNLRLYDEVGNVTTPSSTTIDSTKTINYMVGYNGMTLSTLTNAFGSATINGRADTLAPNLLLTSIPRVTGSHWRWLAFDDSDVPNESSQTAIVYRYSINGGAYSDWNGDTFINMPGTSITVQARDLSGNVSTVTYPDNPVSPSGVAGSVFGRTQLQGKVYIR